MTGASSTRRRAAAPAPVIVLARDQASLYEFLKPRQEGAGTGRVVLDRREADRRRKAKPVAAERRAKERRAEVSDADRALMSVLGFSVLRPDGGAGQATTRRRAATKPARRASARRQPAASTPSRRRPPKRAR